MANMAFIAVLAVGVFEVAVMCGVLELRAQTVAKYAPWAYEPFLRLIGEHPESSPRWAEVEQEKKSAEPQTVNPVGVAGLVPEEPETNRVESAAPVVIEPSVPKASDAPSPNTPAVSSEAVVPVG